MERGQGEPVVKAPAVTVVVVNYNGGDYLRGCLASLARQTFTDFETIVIDNASSDDSLSCIGEQPARTIILRQDSNLGFAGGNNVGARVGTGRWLALLNPDAEASTHAAPRRFTPETCSSRRAASTSGIAAITKTSTSLSACACACACAASAASSLPTLSSATQAPAFPAGRARSRCDTASVTVSGPM